MQRLTITHVRRWQEHKRRVGDGHVYQGWYKSFPCQRDAHLLALCRYVERNAARAGLVQRAEDWRWCSLWRRRHVRTVDDLPVLSNWPADRPRNWVWRVNQLETAEELAAMRQSVLRGRPLGRAAWVQRVATLLALESSFRPRGRPRKGE